MTMETTTWTPQPLPVIETAAHTPRHLRENPIYEVWAGTRFIALTDDDETAAAYQRQGYIVVNTR